MRQTAFDTLFQGETARVENQPRQRDRLRLGLERQVERQGPVSGWMPASNLVRLQPFAGDIVGTYAFDEVENFPVCRRDAEQIFNLIGAQKSPPVDNYGLLWRALKDAGGGLVDSRHAQVVLLRGVVEHGRRE